MNAPLYCQPLEYWKQQMDKMNPDQLRIFKKKVHSEWLSRQLRALPQSDLEKLMKEVDSQVRKAEVVHEDIEGIHYESDDPCGLLDIEVNIEGE